MCWHHLMCCVLPTRVPPPRTLPWVQPWLARGLPLSARLWACAYQACMSGSMGTRRWAALVWRPVTRWGAAQHSWGTLRLGSMQLSPACHLPWLSWAIGLPLRH